MKNKQKPILFSTPMVQAILEGRKQQTRRAIKLPTKWNPTDDGWDWIALQDFYPEFKCPYGNEGDVLWVRESYSHNYFSHNNHAYKADWNNPDPHVVPAPKWKPSIHMPKEACRIFLKITNIRIERLQDISNEDSEKEGVLFDVELPMPEFKKETFYRDYTKETSGYIDAKSSFMTLWKSINGKGSWDSDPWVWVIEFERINHI